MRTRRFQLSLAIIVITACFCSTAWAQSDGWTPKEREFLRKSYMRQARSSYYSLRALGLEEMQSTIMPNWEVVAAAAGVTDAQQRALTIKLFSPLHFSMLLNSRGKVTVTRRSDTPPANDNVRRAHDLLYFGIQQTVESAFAMWSLFMFNSPLPEVQSEYQVEDLGAGKFRLFYKEGTDGNVTLLIDPGFVITEMRVDTPQFTNIVKPRFTKTPQGLVLAGYVADYTAKPASGITHHVEAKLDYALVNGMQLPGKLAVTTAAGGPSSYSELIFSDHQVKVSNR